MLEFGVPGKKGRGQENLFYNESELREDIRQDIPELKIKYRQYSVLVLKDYAVLPFAPGTTFSFKFLSLNAILVLFCLWYIAARRASPFSLVVVLDCPACCNYLNT
jgi:hypothetical protein